jgi:hypothetical protein
MEDIRSNPEEESLESPESREEVETFNEATHEPGAQIEQTGDIQTAEAIEASISELTEVANEVALDDLPDEVVVGTASVSMEAPDPGPHPPPELKEEESTLGTAPSEMPPEMEKSDETVGLKWDESAMVKGSPESTEQIKSLGGSDDEALDGKGFVAKEGPTPDPHPPDNEGMQVLEEEAILREAPSEMPPEMNKLESEEVVGWKFYKPVPAEEDLSAMVKGEVSENPDGPTDPDIRPEEVVGMKFHPGEEVTGSISPGVDQVSKIDSFTKEGELREPGMGEDLPDLEAPPISELSEDSGFVKQTDELSKDPAYLEASELDITDAESHPPEGDEIEAGD